MIIMFKKNLGSSLLLLASSLSSKNPVGKIVKKQSEGVHFLLFGAQNTLPNCQKYTPTDCFFGDLRY